MVEERKSAHLQIVAQASITRQLKLRMEKAAVANSKSPPPPLVVVPQGPTLTPVPAPAPSTNGSGSGDSTSASSNLNLKDFETDGDPFETVTLKAINERAELESIWGTSPQTETQPTTTQSAPQLKAVETSHPVPGIPIPSGQMVGTNQSLVGGGSQIDRAPSPDAQGRPVPKPRRFVPPKLGSSPPQLLGTSPPAHPQGLVGGAVGSVAPVLVNIGEVPAPVVTQTPAPVTAAATTAQVCVWGVRV